MSKNYTHTIYACFVGYIVQAIVNNFLPLLFLTMQASYGIPLEKITFLITFNFGLQLCIDLCSVWFVDRIGYRACMLIAHGAAALGLVLLTVLPEVCPDPFAGLMIAVVIYAVGGGLMEVLLSPIVEACPTPNKEKAMSMLHSFYNWGHMGVVLISVLFFSLFGIQNWKLLSLFWALIPLCNGIAFARVPLVPLVGDGERGLTVRELFRKPVFWLMLLMMLCSGASEQAVSQWASALAEREFGITKTVGDLAGPMSFAFLMGLSRFIYGKFGDRLNLNHFMTGSALLCILSYLLICLAPGPIPGMVGCALCGLSVGILWPGTFSIGSASIPNGGTAMFALFALGGDLGCSLGPTLAGTMSGILGGSLRRGILVSVVFPVVLLTALLIQRRRTNLSS